MISILYVDDEPDLLEIAKLFMEQSGEFTIATATSAQEALGSAAIRSCDVIISDYMMPGMDGIAFLKEVREQLGDVPFILFTGRGREEVVINAINNGADFYLQKGGDPRVQFAELAHKVRQAVTRRQAVLSRIESEKRLADIINFLPDATFAIDKSGIVIAWNRAIEEMTGVAAADMLGKGNYEYAIPFYGTRRKILIDLIFEPDGVIAKRYTHIFHEKGILIADTSLPRPQGRTVTLMGKASPLYNRRGEMAGAIESIRDITDRKKAEEDLLRAKKDWETIFRAIGHPAFVLDHHHRILDVNDATIRATGMSMGELKGKYCYEVFHKPGTAGPPVSCPCEKLMKTGRAETEEMEVEALNGFYSVTCTPVFDDDGRLEKVIHIAMDITARKRTEDELRAAYEQIAASEEELKDQYDELARSEQRIRESEIRFRDLSELLPQAIFEMDLDLRITYANMFAFKSMGLSRDDLDRGINALSFVDAGQHGRAREALEKLLRGEPNEDYEFTAIRTDGSRFPALIYTAALYRDRALAGFRGVLVDISAMKKTEEEIRKSEAFYRTVLRTAMDGYCIIERTGSFSDVNDSFCAMLGYTRAEALALSLPLVDARETSDETARHMEEIVRKGEDRFETVFRCRDGRIIDAEVSVVYTGPQDGRFITFSRDITGRKKAEAALRESEAQYRTIFEATGTASVVLENDGTICLANTEFEHVSGYKRPEIENKKRWMEFVIPEDLERMLAQHRLRRVEPGKALRHYEFRFVTRSGGIRDIFLTIDMIPGTTRSIASLLDITERKQTEERLVRANQEYTDLLNQIQDVYYRSDTEGRLIRASRSLATILGYDDLKECLGKNIADEFYLNPPDRKPFLDQIRLYGKVTNYEILLKKKDGTPVIIETSSHQYCDPDGNVLGIEGTFRDVTERRRVADALRMRDRAIASSINAVVIADLNGIITYVNDAFVRMWGYTPEEAIGRPVTLLGNTPFEVERYIDLFRTRGYAVGESVAKRRDGSPLPVQISGSLVRSETGEPEALLATFIDITERKAAEDSLRSAYERIAVSEEELRSQYNALAATQQELRKQQQQLAEIANMVPGVVYQLYARPDGTRGLYYVSRRASEVFGFPMDTDDFYGWFVAHVDPRDRDAFLRSNDEVIASGSPWNFEGRFIKSSGETLWFQGLSRPVRHGPELVFNGLLLDITDRKQAELAVRENEQKYRTLIETTGTGFVIIDGDGRVLDANPEYVRLTGYASLAGIVGRSIIEWTADYDREKNTEAVRQCVGEGFIRNFEIDYRDRQGGITPVEINATVLKTEGQIRILTLCRDISGRRRSENALKASEEKFRTVVETAEEGIWIISEEFLTLFTNRKMQEIFGYPLEEMTGRPVWDFVPPDDVESMKQELLRRPRGTSGRYERRWVRKDGTVIWCLTTGTPLFSPGGKFAGSFGMFTDITGRKEMEGALRESEAKYRTVVEQSNDGIFIVQDARLVFYNRAFSMMTGYDEAELIGRSIPELIAPEDRATTMARHAARTSGKGAPEKYEFAILHKDGSTRIHVMMHAGIGTYRGKPATFGTFHDVTEERKREEALRESEEKYRSLIEHVQDVIYRSDREGNLIMASPSFVTLLGYDSLDECIGRNLADQFWMEPWRRKEFLAILREKGSISGYEIILKKKDGSPVIVSASSHVYHAGDGTVAGVEGIFHDITEIRLAQQQANLLAALNDISPASVIVHSPDGEILYANQRTFELYGRTRDEFMALNLHQIDVPENRHLTEQRIEQLRKTGAASYDSERIRKNGSRIPLRVNAMITRWNDREVVLSVSTDISEQKSVEHALRESESRLRSILLGSPVLQFVIDNNHRIISWNRAIEEYSGIRAAEIIGTDQQWRAFYPEKRPVLADLILEGDADDLLRWYGNNLKKSRYVEGALEGQDFFPRMGPAGTWLSFTAAPILDAGGSIIGAVETLEDITIRVNMENAIRAANRKLTLLNSITRHDVANQLTVLRGYVTAAAVKESDPAVAGLLARIEATAQTIGYQIELAKTYQDLGVGRPDWFRIDDIVKRTKQGAVNYSTVCRHAEIFADPLLDRVFFNLFDNAIRHGERVTEIMVRCEDTPDGLLVIIEDNGIGVPSEEKEKIFGKMYGKHTGYGLFLVKEILAITGLTIRETGCPGTGARFEIAVPAGKFRFRPGKTSAEQP